MTPDQFATPTDPPNRPMVPDPPLVPATVAAGREPVRSNFAGVTAPVAFSNGDWPAARQAGVAIYVDTENLGDPEQAQRIVRQAIANWPADQPAVTGLSLYVRADEEALWRLWAEGEYPTLRVRVRGVQHFSKDRAKNSADLAITADAIGDLFSGLAGVVAVISNDSDFGALYVKVQELAHRAGLPQTPFRWVTVAGAGKLSPKLELFLPDSVRMELAAAPPEPDAAQPAPETDAGPGPSAAPPASPRPARPADSGASKTPAGASGIDSVAVAEELIRRLPVGRFKVADAFPIVKKRWPNHPDAGNAPTMGQYLLNTLWPILEKRGVKMPRKTSPRTYEMTKAAKDSLAKAAAPPAQPVATAPRPTSGDVPSGDAPTEGQLAAAVAAAITDDIFKSSDAQAAIRDQWPEHPAASYLAPQFGAWLTKQLWPVMKEHGVTLANEKPRRYEMTPDARHRLIALG